MADGSGTIDAAKLALETDEKKKSPAVVGKTKLDWIPAFPKCGAKDVLRS